MTCVVSLPVSCLRELDPSLKTSFRATPGSHHRERNLNEQAVRFAESEDRVSPVHRCSKESSWYSESEIREFRRLAEKNEVEASRKRGNKHLLMSSHLRISTEDFPLHGFREGKSESRKELISSVLLHQSSCGQHGVVGPDEIHAVSSERSRADRVNAWRVATFNAYEVESFRGGPESISLGSLIMDYYWQSIHPYLDDPIGSFSKMLLFEIDG